MSSRFAGHPSSFTRADLGAPRFPYDLAASGATRNPPTVVATLSLPNDTLMAGSPVGQGAPANFSCALCPGPPAVDPSTGDLLLPLANTTSSGEGEVLMVNGQTLHTGWSSQSPGTPVRTLWVLAAREWLVLSWSPRGGNLTWLNATLGTQIMRVPLGGFPEDAAYDPLQNQLLIVFQSRNLFTTCCSEVTFLNASTGTVLGNATLTGAEVSVGAVTFDQSRDLYYVEDQVTSSVFDPNTTYYISTLNPRNASVETEHSIGVSPYGALQQGGGVTVDPTSGNLLVASPDGQNDVASLTLPGLAGVWDSLTGPAPAAPLAVPATPFAIVPEGAGGNVSVVNLSTGAHVGLLSVGIWPSPAALDPPRGYVVLGNDLSDSVSFLGNASGPTIVRIVPSNLSAPVNVSQTFQTYAEGGVPPLNYTYAGLPPGCKNTSSPIVTCHPGSEGNYSIRVSVTDLLAHGASRSLWMNVTAPPKETTPPPGPSPPAAWYIQYRTGIILGLIAVVAAVGLISTWRFRRRSSRTGQVQSTLRPVQPQ